LCTVEQRDVHAVAAGGGVMVKRAAFPCGLEMRQSPERQTVVESNWREARVGEYVNVVRPFRRAIQRGGNERVVIARRNEDAHRPPRREGLDQEACGLEAGALVLV